MSNWQGRKVFVSGGTGFIGFHLSKKLRELGADLRLLIHETESSIETVSPARVDLRDELSNAYLYGYLDMMQPEVIFHLAAQPLVSVAGQDELDTLRTNVDGTYNLLHACKNLPSLKSFVHISTDKVYGNVPIITEFTRPFGVEHPYNVSKLAGDMIAQMYSTHFDIPMVIIRNANVYGAGDTHFDRIIPRTIKNILDGVKPVVRGDGSNTRDYVHVDDIVDGYLRAAELPYKEKLTTLNLGGHNHSVIQVIDSILGKMSRVDLAPTFEKQWKGEIPHQHIVSDKARDLIDWNPQIDLDSGLDKTIEWYRGFFGKG